MWKHEVEEFVNYEVYEILEKDGKKECHIICLCHDYKMAEGLCRVLASNDDSGDKYYFTGVNHPGDFVPGGGWYECYYKDKETGKLKHSSLS